MASANYQRQRAWREAHPESVARERRRNAARQRALVRLAREYPEEYRYLYAHELEVAGLARARADLVDGLDGAGNMGS